MACYQLYICTLFCTESLKNKITIETCAHETRTKSPEILDGYLINFQGVLRVFITQSHPQWLITKCTTHWGWN